MKGDKKSWEKGETLMLVYARVRGASWDSIAKSFGRSKSSVQTQFHNVKCGVDVFSKWFFDDNPEIYRELFYENETEWYKG